MHRLHVPFPPPPSRWEFSVSIWEFGAHVLGFTHWHLTILTSGKKIHTSSFFSLRLNSPETSLRIKEQKIRPENYFHHACSSETGCIYKTPLDCQSAVWSRLQQAAQRLPHLTTLSTSVFIFHSGLQPTPTIYLPLNKLQTTRKQHV